MSIDADWDQPGLVGQRAGHYRIVSEVATDNRRTLCEAEHVDDGTRVTLAVVRGGATGGGADKLRELNHTGLVRVLEVGKLESGEQFVATERAVGTSLRELIKGKRIEQRRALAIGRQAVEALAALHAAGAIHGDIKPENILVTADGRVERVKLVELGVGMLTTAPGDPRYAPPESDRSAIDARGDIYAVGAVLFELLTGHPPFVSDDAKALRRMHSYAPTQTLKQRAPELSFVRALEELVAMALAKKPEARLQSAGEMLPLLDNAVHSIEEVAPPEPEVASPRRRPANDSLAQLAKGLMPKTSVEPLAIAVPVNVDRHVPELPLPTRVWIWLRKAVARLRPLVDKLAEKIGVARLSRRHQWIMGSVAVVVVIAIMFAIGAATCGGGGKPKSTASAAKSDKPGSYVWRAENQLAAGEERDALATFETGFAAEPALAKEPAFATSLNQLAGSHDAEVRHRAVELADRAAIKGGIDRVASWLLDLEQATTCDDRRV